MANYTVGANDRGAYELSGAANTEDAVTLNCPLAGGIEVKLLTGASPLYFTIDNTAATVKGAHCFDVQPGTGMQAWNLSFGVPAVIRLISAGNCTYSVSALNQGVLS